MTPTTITHLTRELDSRTIDGIEVRLLWSEHDGRVLVAVSDAKTGDAFSIEVREGDRRWTCSITRTPTARPARSRSPRR